MTKIASHHEKNDYYLRSGNAEGEEQAFAFGVEQRAQIWLQWNEFQKEFMRNTVNRYF